MNRFYSQNGIITGEEQTHLSRVLRLQVGDTVELMQDGGLYLARIEQVEKERTICAVLHALPSREPALRVTLYIGQLKGEKMDWVVQKATELGVHAVQPLLMHRSVAQGAGKAERWRRIAREAAKQCGRACPPRIGEPVAFEGAMDMLGSHEVLLMPYEGGGAPLGAQALRGDTALLIGPEGGITPEEVEAACALGGQRLTLGPRILRAETAALATLSAIMLLGGEWEGGA